VTPHCDDDDRRGHCGGRGHWQRDRLPPGLPRSRSLGNGRGTRLELSHRFLGTVSRLDPTAVLDAAQYDDVATHLAVEDHAPDIGLVERGYLYLASVERQEQLRSHFALQRRHGVDVALLNAAELGARFAWLSTSDVCAGSLGLSGEGWFDGYSVLQAFRRKARALGVTYLRGEVAALDLGETRVNALLLQDGRRVKCGKVVNAAGPYARAIAEMARMELPIVAEKHCIFVFSCPDPPASCPLVIDPTGVYVRPEGRHFIAGPPRNPDSEVGDGLEVDYRLFEDVVWPTLAARIPAFESIRLVNAWAGYYEMNTFDHNAVIGRAPDIENLYFANGFSGHGMQHSPAVGRGMAELLLFDEFRTLDLTALSIDRLGRAEPIRESNII
jgi:FAD-dependent oxidoreductase domain-containing protein 1